MRNQILYFSHVILFLFNKEKVEQSTYVIYFRYQQWLHVKNRKIYHFHFIKNSQEKNIQNFYN